jgi:hypothetical protein
VAPWDPPRLEALVDPAGHRVRQGCPVAPSPPAVLPGFET